MAKSNPLQELIDSLSPSEKGYVSKSAYGKADQLSYLRLFDALKKGGVSDDELKRKYKGEPFLKHLSKNKNHLYDLIVSKLVQYHENNDVSLKLRSEYSKASMLVKKGLITHAVPKLERLVQKAFEIQEYGLAVQVLKDLKFVYYTGQIGPAFKFKDEFKKAVEVLNKEDLAFVNQTELAEIMFSEALSKQELKKRIEGLIKESKKSKISELPSFIVEWGDLCIVTHGNYLLGNHDVAQDNKERQLKFLKENWDITMKNPDRYLKHLINLINGKINVADYENTAPLMKELLEFRNPISDASRTLQFSSYYIHGLVICTSTGEFKKAKELLLEGEAWFRENDTLVSDYFKLLFYHEAFVVFFGLNDLKNANRCLNTIVHEKSLFRKQIQLGVQLDYIMLHLEKENFELVESKVNSVYRQVIADADLEENKQIVDQVKRIFSEIEGVGENEKIITFQKVVEEVLVQDNWNSIFKTPFVAWLFSKNRKTSFVEAYKKLRAKK